MSNPKKIRDIAEKLYGKDFVERVERELPNEWDFVEEPKPQRLPDCQQFGYVMRNLCFMCSADLPDDEEFQALHMEKEHGLIV